MLLFKLVGSHPSIKGGEVLRTILTAKVPVGTPPSDIQLGWGTAIQAAIRAGWFDIEITMETE